MAMTTETFSDSVLGLCNLAKASGLSDERTSFALLLTALALADRNSKDGFSREDFLMMAGVVHDSLRSALNRGAQA